MKKLMWVSCVFAMILCGCSAHQTDQIEPYSVLLGSTPDHNQEEPNGKLLYDLLRQASASTVNTYQETGFVVDRYSGANHLKTLVFEQDGWTYCIDERFNYLDSIPTVITIKRFKDNEQELISLNMNEDGSYQTAEFVTRKPEVDGDKMVVMEQPILEAVGDDGFAMIEKFPDYFIVWKETDEQIEDPLTIILWTITDRQELKERLSSSEFKKTGIIFSQGLPLRIECNSEGTIIRWSTVSGDDKKGEIYPSGNLDKGFYADLMDQHPSENEIISVPENAFLD